MAGSFVCERKQQSTEVWRFAESAKDYPGMLQHVCGPGGVGGRFPFKTRSNGEWNFQTSCSLRSASSGAVYRRFTNAKRVIRNQIIPLYVTLCTKKDGKCILPSGWQKEDMINAIKYNLALREDKVSADKDPPADEKGGKGSTRYKRQKTATAAAVAEGDCVIAEAEAVLSSKAQLGAKPGQAHRAPLQSTAAPQRPAVVLNAATSLLDLTSGAASSAGPYQPPPPPDAPSAPAAEAVGADVVQAEVVEYETVEAEAVEADDEEDVDSEDTNGAATHCPATARHCPPLPATARHCPPHPATARHSLPLARHWPATSPPLACHSPPLARHSPPLARTNLPLPATTCHTPTTARVFI